MSYKKLILIRHAHRDTSNREEDNGLTEKGRNQAEKVREYYRKNFSKMNDDAKFLSVTLLSSPKARCVETLEPLSEIVKKQIRTENLLDEGGDLDEKIRKFTQWWIKEAPDFIVACSHGDWIPLFLSYLFNQDTDIKKGGWVEIDMRDKIPELVRILQELP